MTPEQAAATAPAADQLRLLVIFHYIFAGLSLLGMGFLAAHYWFMSSMMDPTQWAGHSNPPPEGFLDMFVWFYAFMGALMALGLVLNLLVAASLRQRRRWTLCAVVSGLNCLQMPLGTILGVFTLVLINRSDVRASFSS
jgi:hypothetical protein